MKLTHDVPLSAQRAAQRALALHKASPLADVGGISVAEVLATGVATIDVVAKVHRFFRVNSRQYAAESQAMHSEHESPLVRSWLLYGAESAQRWAADLYRKAVAEGYRPQDAVTDLFHLQPDDVYAAFSVGAWRFEYDLDPRKAARFVEEYHRATGWNLDLHRAFGDSVGAVSNALYRRFHPVDPFKEAARCLTVEDVDYRLAAQVDLAELTHSVDALEESLKPMVWNASAAITAKMVWPAFVAYMILASERPDLIATLNKDSAKPPLQNQKPKAFAQYHDAINTYVAFFHPDGTRFFDPLKSTPENAKAFGSLPAEMEELMVRAYHGRTISPVNAQKLLGKARRWTAENKFAGSLFHVFNADWKKGNWQHILDNIPEDADVRPAFAEFAKENPMPVEGVKLQQTLSDKALKVEVAAFLASEEHIEDSSVEFLDAVKIDGTAAGEAAEAKGTPIGVYSVFEYKGEKNVVLGAFKTNNPSKVRFVVRQATGTLITANDLDFANSIKNGNTVVLLAHKDMPGSSYTAKKIQPKPSKSVSADDVENDAPQADPAVQTPSLVGNGVPADALSYMKAHGYVNAKTAKEVMPFELANTKFAQLAKEKYGKTVRVGHAWERSSDFATPFKGTLVGAFKWHPASVPFLIFKSTTNQVGDAAYLVYGDKSSAEDVKSGALRPQGVKAADGPTAPFDAEVEQYAQTGGKMTDAQLVAAAKQEIVAYKSASALTTWVDKNPLDTIFHAWSQYNAEQAAVLQSKWQVNGKLWTLVGCIHSKTLGTYVVFRGPDGTSLGELHWMSTEAAVSSLKSGTLKPWGQLSTVTIKDQEAQKLDPPAPFVATSEPSPKKFGNASVIEWGSSYWYVVAHTETGVPHYHLLELAFSGTYPPSGITKMSQETVDQTAKYVDKIGVQNSPVPFYAYTKLPPQSEIVPASQQLEGLGPGSDYQLDGKTWTVVRYLELNKKVYVFAACTTMEPIGSGMFADSWKFAIHAASSLPVVKSSYQPTDMKPEIPHEADEPDPEQGSSELSGTAFAHDFLLKRGWTPAVASDSPVFLFPLGGRQFYGATTKRRTVIGYGLDAQGTPVYVHVTEANNIGWVTCVNAHTKYGPLDAMEQGVVDALLPKPGAKPVKFPKLNYKLSSAAKKIAQETGLVFVPAPKTSKFYVNTPLSDDAGKDVVLIGWMQLPAKEEPTAVIFDPSNSNPLQYGVFSIHALNSQFTLRYEHPSVLNHDTGEVTFGKKATASTFNAALGVNEKTLIPSEPPVGWDDVAFLKQPPTPYISGGKHVSAGIIAIVPAGSTISLGSGKTVLPYASVVLYHPMGNFGGYKLNIPKGTVDKGESLLMTAVREFHEETGLTAKPVAYLGDFRGNQSMTRLYMGYVTGGHPAKKTQPEECDAVTFKPLVGIESNAYRDEKWFAQLIPQSGNKWQQHAIDAAVEWIQENGIPELFTPEVETEDSAVSIPTDVPDPFVGVDPKPANPYDVIAAGFDKLSAAAQKAGKAIVVASQSLITAPPPANWKPSVPPSDVEGGDPWKALLFKSPFPVTSVMVNVLKSKLVPGVVPEAFDCARNRPNGPKYGESFETKGGTPYLAAGYVSWKGSDGQLYNHLIVMTSAGSVDALPAVPDGLANYKISSDQSLAAGSETAWYAHPDPTVNATIKSVYQTGTLDGSGVNMKTFKESWMKTAGVPAYAVITANMLRDVASLFVPGACPQVIHDAILLSLKSRMKATHSGKKGASTPIAASTFGSASPPVMAIPVLPSPPQIVLPTGPLSPVLKQYVNAPQSFLFSETGQSVKGGSKPNMLLNGPGGKQWFAKYAPGEDWRAYVDRAAYQLAELCKPNNIPVGVMAFGGKIVSFQPFAAEAKPPPADPTDLDEQNMAELLSQHAVDMFMGDHDGHAGNWISVGGRILAVDRGQAFKFLLQGKTESLDPTWHAPGNIGQGYAKQLLIQWSKGEVEIPASAWVAMLKTIRGVAKISGEQLKAVLQPLFNEANTPVPKQLDVYTKLRDRGDTYEKDWTKVLRSLRKSFDWPTVSATAAPTKVFTSSPKDVGFGKREEKVIAEAVAAKWQGKTVQIGGLAFENQEVMVRRVMWEEKPGLKVAATMIHFRVARPAGIGAAKKLYGSSNLEVTETLGGPQRLKADHQGGFWEKIYAAVKTLNHHLFKQKDTAVNEVTIGTMSGLRPILNNLVKITSDSSGVYAPTNEPNEAVYAMAEQYLQYLGIVEYWVAKKAELVGQHSPTLVEFLWEPPVPDHAVAKDAPPYKVSLKKQGALWPTAVSVGQEIHVTNLNKPVMNSAQQSQFVIEDPLTKARVFWNPPGGVATAGVEHVKDGVESLKGQGWAIVPGEPSTATVAHLLKLFSDATGISTQAASQSDAEALYWSKQAAVLQGGGSVKPKSDHTIVVEPGYAAALAPYASGNAPQAVGELKKYVAGKLGLSVAEVEKLAPPEAIAGKYTRGAGFMRHERIGWTRERLQQQMGKDCRLAHSLSDTPVAWMHAMKTNGALLSNAIKAFYGVTKTGASPGSDMNQGGGQGLFLCFRKGFASQAGMLYFDISLALRLDVYIVGTGDTYGNTGTERHMTPEKWTALGAHQGTGYCGASSSLQVSIRHDIDIQQYLVAVMCGSQSAKAECIQIAKALGWTFYGGASPEEVFRVG